jgi:hypothetical protein
LEVDADQLVAVDGLAGGNNQGQGRFDQGVAGRRGQAGGLSLKIDLPQGGQRLVFSKAGGDPVLGLAVRHADARRQGLGLAWTAAWLLGGLLAVRTLARGWSHQAGWLMGGGLCVLGAAGTLVLTGLAAAIAFGLFVGGVVWLAVLCLRLPRPTA